MSKGKAGLKDFLRKHNACRRGAEWAIENCTSLSDMWEKLPDAPNKSWMVWVATRHGVFSDKELRLFACRVVRTTPIGGGKVLWDLLTDERSRNAVEVAERYAAGNATDAELAAAHASHAPCASYATYATTSAFAAFAASCAAAAAWDACDVSYAAAAKDCINGLLAGMGNPFDDTGKDKDGIKTNTTEA